MRDLSFPRQRLFRALPLLLLLVMAASLCLGSAGLSLSELYQGLRDPHSAAYRILFYARLPRMLGGLLAGASLAVSGALLQNVLNNSLAGPNVIGVNAGAGLGTLIVMSISPFAVQWMPMAAFFGALLTALLIYAVASISGASRTTLILAGVAISSIINAVSACIKTFFPELSLSYATFSVGSLANTTMDQVKWAAVYALPALLAVMLVRHDMNILALGEETAGALGLTVRVYRFLLICLAAVLAGAAVSYGGLIGFVGLLVPHMARMLFGSDHRIAVPASALLGAISLLLCDLLGRTLFAPFELHVGIVLSVIGGAGFIFLILKRKGGRLS